MRIFVPIALLVTGCAAPAAAPPGRAHHSVPIANEGGSRMDWQDALVARLADRITNHGLLVDLEPYRQQLELAAVENPVDQAALEAEMFRLWQLWHEGFASHAVVLDAEIREHLTTEHVAGLGDQLVAAVPAARFGANPPARVVWVLLTAIQRYEIAGETPQPPPARL